MIRILNQQDALLKSCAKPATNSSYTHAVIKKEGDISLYSVDNLKNTDFWIQYCDLSVKALKDPNNYFACLYEKPEEEMPVTVEFLFTWINPKEELMWNEEFLPTIARIYQTLIAENFRFENAEYNLHCCVLESKLWKKSETEQCIDVRLQFPYCKINTSFFADLRKKAIAEIRRVAVSSLFYESPLGEWENMINLRTGFEPLLMYGSRKLPHSAPMILTKIFEDLTREEEETDDEEDLYEGLLLEDCFTPSNHSHSFILEILRLPYISRDDYEDWLPLFFSTQYWMKIMKSVNEDVRKQKTPQHNNVPILGGPQEHFDESNIDLAVIFLEMINNDRFLNEASWTTIGKALYYASEGHDDGLQLWIRYSKQAISGIPKPPAYLNGEIEYRCTLKYYTFPSNGTSVKSLAIFAQDDAPEKYTSWHDSWVGVAMNTALSQRDVDMACALYRMYWLEFVCVSASGSIQKWYRFDGVRWKQLEAGVYLRRAITNQFEPKFRQCVTHLSRLSENCKDPHRKAQYDETIDSIRSLIKKLGKTGTKNAIMKEVAERFLCESFSSYLDKNPLLLGTPRGILEVVDKKIIFRKGMPEDFITRTTAVPYLQSFSWNHASVKGVMEWMRKVFIDNDLRHYALKFFSSILRGGNIDKIFVALTGSSGDNSKTSLVKCICMMLGPQYSVKLNNESLTSNERTGSNATPQWARIEGTRLVVCDEMGDTPLKKNIIKKMTGQDSIYVRANYTDGQDIEVQAKLLEVANDPPEIETPDKPVQKRFKNIPCLSQFVPEEEAPSTEEEQFKKGIFPMDKTFDRLLAEYAPAMLWVFVEFYPYYAEEGLGNEPKIVIDYTKKFWNENDMYGQYLEECVPRTSDKRASVSLKVLYDNFKDWFYQTYPNSAAPERRTFKVQMNNRLGPQEAGSWYGIVVNEDGLRRKRAKEEDE